MQDYQDRIGGNYIDSFGIMYLNADYSKPPYSKEQDRTFVHEEIHYFQNFYTYYGVHRTIYRLFVLHSAVIHAQKGRYATKVGFSLQEEFEKSVFETVSGDSFDTRDNRNGIFLCYSITDIKIDNLNICYEDDFPDCMDLLSDYYVLTYHDGDTGGHKFQFGGEAICESMAYLVEVLMFDETERYYHSLPYNACEMVYEYYTGRQCKDIPLLVFIAQCSLMTSNPGKTFVDIVKEISKQEEASIEVVFRITEEKLEHFTCKQIEKINKYLDLLMPEAQKDDPYNKPPYDKHFKKLEFTKNWLKNQYKAVVDKQEDVFCFFARILRESSERIRRKYISCFIDYIGQPIVIDKTGYLYEKNSKCGDERIMLLAIEALEQLLRHKKGKCYIYDICPRYTNAREDVCSKYFWRHATDSGVCIAKFYLHVVGLEEIDFCSMEGTPF